MRGRVEQQRCERQSLPSQAQGGPERGPESPTARCRTATSPSSPWVRTLRRWHRPGFGPLSPALSGWSSSSERPRCASALSDRGGDPDIPSRDFGLGCKPPSLSLRPSVLQGQVSSATATVSQLPSTEESGRGRPQRVSFVPSTVSRVGVTSGEPGRDAQRNVPVAGDRLGVLRGLLLARGGG